MTKIKDGVVTVDGVVVGKTHQYRDSKRWGAYAPGARYVGVAGYGYRTRAEAVEALIMDAQKRCAAAAFGEVLK